MSRDVKIVRKTTQEEREALGALLTAEGRQGWPRVAGRVHDRLSVYCGKDWASVLDDSDLKDYLESFKENPPEGVSVRGAIKAVEWGYMHPAVENGNMTLAHVSEQRS